MAITQHTFTWRPIIGFDRAATPLADQAQLVLLFASGNLMPDLAVPVREVIEMFPNAEIVGCSTAGEILDVAVGDSSIVGIALHFSATTVRTALVADHGHNLNAAVDRLVTDLQGENLRYVLLLSEGLYINGSELASAMQAALGDDVVITGGMAGDGERFSTTTVFHNDRLCSHGIVAVGLYGNSLRVGHGSMGGWDPFGPTRTVTRSEDNKLYELDGVSALDLYKRYLGTYAESLPATGLLFPLSIRPANREHELVRTLLAIDEEAQSMTFAGTVPPGSQARFMKANFDRLVDGAAGAADQAKTCLQRDADVALLISCVGRRMVLGDLVEEELDAVREVLGTRSVLVGFYSYGELSPVADYGCELHNQTMTITTLSED